MNIRSRRTEILLGIESTRLHVNVGKRHDQTTWKHTLNSCRYPQPQKSLGSHDVFGSLKRPAACWPLISLAHHKLLRTLPKYASQPCKRRSSPMKTKNCCETSPERLARRVFFPVSAVMSHKTEDPRNPRNSCIRLHRPTPMTLQTSQHRSVCSLPYDCLCFRRSCESRRLCVRVGA
jgi:hypothetical protein